MKKFMVFIGVALLLGYLLSLRVAPTPAQVTKAECESR